MFSAPALFSNHDGRVGAWLCELQVKDTKRQLRFLEQSRGSIIDIRLEPSGHIALESDTLSIGEVGRRMKGSGRLLSDKEARGKMTVISGSSGFLLLRREKSEWYLRAATETEIASRMMKGLERVALSLSRLGIEPNPENIRKYLFFGDGYGYSHADLAKIREMLDAGELVFSESHFQLKDELTEEQVTPAPISAETVIRDIPIRSSDH